MDREPPTRMDRAAGTAREVAIVVVTGAVQLAGTTAAARRQPEALLSLWPVGHGLLAVSVLLLPLRHRYPVATFWWVFALTLAYWSAGFPHGPVFAAMLVAFGRLVTGGRRRMAFAAIAVGFVAFPWLGVVLDRREPPSTTFLAGLLAWLIALVSVMEALRYRRDRAAEAARSRTEAARRRAGEERLRIAREVHDTVAHAMSLITIQAGVALHRGGDLPPQTREALAIIRSSSREALVELRAILGVLRDGDGGAPRAPRPGLAQLDDLTRWAQQAGLEVSLTVRDLPPDGVPGTVDIAAYRILQETLTNVARHAGGSTVAVHVAVRDGVLALDVENDGAAVPPGPGSTAEGNGIVGMRERAAALGGTLTAEPRQAGGFAVRARLPLAGRRDGVGPALATATETTP